MNSQTSYKLQATSLIAIVVLAASAGCDSKENRVSFEAHLRSPEIVAPCTFEADIIFADEPSYRCIPLDKLRVSGTVVSLYSTCECIRPSIVDYQATSRETKKALYLDLQPPESDSNLDESSNNLSVIVTLIIDDGTTQTVVIDVVHARRVKGQSSPGADPS